MVRRKKSLSQANKVNKTALSAFENGLDILHQLQVCIEEETHCLTRGDLDTVRSLYPQKQVLVKNYIQWAQDTMKAYGKSGLPDAQKPILKKKFDVLKQHLTTNHKLLVSVTNRQDKKLKIFQNAVKKTQVPSSYYTKGEQPKDDISTMMPFTLNEIL